MSARAKVSGLDLEVPQVGAAADAYNVACTAAMLRAAILPGGASTPIFEAPRHAVTLHRLSGMLHRMAEAECNGYVRTCHACEGDGTLPRGAGISPAPGRPERRTCPKCAGHGSANGRRLERLREQARDIATYYGLRIYFQTDPRGCALYLISPEMLERAAEQSRSEAGRNHYRDADDWIRANYNRGHAVVRLGR